MIEAIRSLSDAIISAHSGFDWVEFASAVCSALSLIGIVVLLIERREKKRPYLVATFELVRSDHICILIRNVGETTAVLKSVKFNPEFVERLPADAQPLARDREMNITIFPKQQWVIYLGATATEVIQSGNTKLTINISYSEIDDRKANKTFIEETKIDFSEYAGFLDYISPLDELTRAIKRLDKSIEKMNTEITNHLRKQDMCEEIARHEITKHESSEQS